MKILEFQISRFLIFIGTFALSIYSCKSRDEKIGNKLERADNLVFISSVLSSKTSNLISLIRDGKLDKKSSIDQLKILLNKVAEQYDRISLSQYDQDKWAFPLKDYTPENSIGGIKDEGYITGKYDFFDGNNHKGHPALDIFISDINQDCLDDVTKEPVDILSITGGVVLAAESHWDTASILRGGKYIWIYDPHNKFLIYYAHNNTINIKLGQIVKPGDKIATCGRTGLSAFKKQSPTHLHLMLLKLDENNYPNPTNPYSYLKTANPL